MALTGVSGIPSSVAFGASGGSVDLTLIGAAGIPSSVAFGASGASILHGITGHTGIVSAVAQGTTGILLLTDPTTSLPAIRVYIAGVDRTSYVQAGLRINSDIGSRSSAEFTLCDINGSYRPARHEEVVVYDVPTARRIFGGYVQSTVESWYHPSRPAMFIDVRCQDYGSICDSRIVAAHYELGTGGLAGIMIYDIVQRFLDGTGIVFAYSVNPPVQFGNVDFNFVTVTEAINQLLSESNWDWRVDYYRTLSIFPKSTGFVAAPIDLADNDGLWKDMTVEKTAAKKVNRQGVKNSQNVGVLWIDSFTGNGSQVFFPTTATLTAKPLVYVNSVAVVVTDYGVWGSPYAFYWMNSGIWQNPNNAPYGGGDTIEIKYPSPLSWVEWAQDSVDIAANGRWEAVEEVKDLSDRTAMQNYAAQLLARAKTEPTVVTFITREPGWEPGQLLSISTTRPLANGSFLVETVDSVEEPNMGFMWHTVKCSDEQLQRTGSANAFFSKMIYRDRNPKDRIIERITFVVAGTIEGITNPGLTTGLKTAVRVAQKDGICRICTLYFKSVQTTPTTADISIDVLKNGVTIFGTTKMQFPAGAAAVQVMYLFASDPLKVKQGDIFTMDVLAADPLAMDGSLELSIFG